MRPLRQPLRPCGADVVLTHDVEQGRPHDAHDRPGAGDAEDERGHDHDLEVLERVRRERHVRPHRRPLEVDGREHHHQDGEPEVGHRQREDGEDAADVVGDGVLADGGHDPDEDADHHGHEDRERRQLDRDGEAPDELVEDRLARPVRVAEVAAEQDSADPVDVLDIGRPIEPHLLPERLDRRRIGMALDHADHHVAGHEAHHREDDDAHQDERRHREGESAEDVRLHRATALPAYRSSQVNMRR